MNNTIKKIDIEKILFFDTECVRRNKELELDSREFQLFQKKTRNRETDEYLTNEEVIEAYKKNAALKMGYSKIVSIGVGFVRDNEVHIKAISGEEGDIIKQFCQIASSFDYVCGANVLSFDLPLLVNNGFRTFDVPTVLPDRFLTSGKKIWNLDKVIDVSDIFKATHYAMSSLDEICYHFGVDSPKTELDGSMVSEEYWTNGVDKINKYVKQDVFAVINVFRKMCYEPIFEGFLDKNLGGNVEETTQQTLLQELYNTKNFSTDFQERLRKQLKERKMLKKEIKTVEKLLLSHYLDKVEITSFDKKEIEASNKERTLEIKNFIKTL